LLVLSTKYTDKKVNSQINQRFTSCQNSSFVNYREEQSFSETIFFAPARGRGAKRVDTTSGDIILLPCAEDDERFPPVPVDPDDEITIFGVVTWVIQKA